MNLAQQCPNVVEFPLPLKPGDRIGSDDRAVLEVAQLRSTLTCAGAERPLFVAVHEKNRSGGMVTLFVSLHDEPQRCWSLGEDRQWRQT